MTFLHPFMLFALAAIPVLWWLMRLIPPRPTTVYFPPLRLLFENPTEETPSQMPWWLVLMRLLLAAAVIFALAAPVLSSGRTGTDTSPSATLLIIDDGWATAADWKARMDSASSLIDTAENTSQTLALLAITSPHEALSSLTPVQAREKLRQLYPKAVSAARLPHQENISRFVNAHNPISIVWYADGLDTEDARSFAQFLADLAPQTTTIKVGERTARGLVEANNAPSELTVKAIRAETSALEALKLNAYDEKGRPVAEATATFAIGSNAAEARFDVPVEVRNDITRIAIVPETSAGGVQLLDNANRRREVGIVSGATQENTHPLIAPRYYLTRALAPIADVRTAVSSAPSEAVDELLKSGISVLILADIATLSPQTREAIIAWRNKGGILVRFAGSRMAVAEPDDDLTPVRVRQGDRTLGGALAWSTPQAMADFPEGSPFWGIPIPDDVRITRQVLAEPSAELAERTWATLKDGTPLVTARKDGKGLTVLFHISAETSWSNLPMSGLFVAMLDHINRLASAYPTESASSGNDTSAFVSQTRQTLPPLKILDGFGALHVPSASTRNLANPPPQAATADTPPGFYGTPENAVALNTLAPSTSLNRLDLAPFPFRVENFSKAQPISLVPWLLGAAFVALLVDTLVVLILGGAFARLFMRRQSVGFLLVAGIMLTFSPSDLRAEISPERERAAIEATRETRLAYMLTGDAEVDAIAKAGLEGLTAELGNRTALEAGAPAALDPEKDDLTFYALIYWPISPNAPLPSRQAMQKVDAFMKQGGSIIFDTRDAGTRFDGSAPASDTLKQMLQHLDVPELQVVPEKHVLTRTFYLLNSFQGRFAQGPLWIEATPQNDDEEEQMTRTGDGVSPILITSNDFAGAWAVLPNGQAMLPVEGNDYERREMATRAGINIVMYAFTGNYKADQVHIPALLERLGQ